jgi:membrane protein
MSLTKVRLSEAWNWGGLSARELAARSWRAIDAHETVDRAAVVASYAMLSLVPMIGLALALATRAGVTAQVEELSGHLLPPKALALVHGQVRKIEEDKPAGLLSLSALLLLWSASSLFVAVMDSTNVAYGVRDGRAWWKRRLLAVALTLIEAVLLVGASASIAAWPHLSDRMGLEGSAKAVATAVQWVVVAASLLAAFALASYYGPNVEQEWEWITPGATLGVLALVAASLGFRLYLRYGPAYSETYGALAGVVLMLLWLYLAALALLVGTEVNCVIEHAAPHGRGPGQKEAPGA